MIYMSQETKERLKDLFVFLNSHNEYYHSIFSNYSIDLSREIDEIFPIIPVITKNHIRKNEKKYYSDCQEEFYEEFTSGTTGIPLKCLKTKGERSALSLNIWKQRRMHDICVSPSNYINIFGHDKKKQYGDYIDLNENSLIDFYSSLNELNPRWLSGSISTIYQFARLIESKKIRKYNTIKYIEFMGESVDVSQRKFIEEIFQCKTINHYGTKETWCIAYECSHGHLHIQDKFIYCEILNPNKTLNGYGEITITSLLNRLMPIVRYNLSDYGRLSWRKCPCGQSSPILELAGGRKCDIIQGRNILGNNYFSRLIKRLSRMGYDHIEAFKVVQKSINNFLMFIVPSNEYTEHTTEILYGLIHEALGEDVMFEFIFVEEIPIKNNKTQIFTREIVEKE